MTQSTPDRHDWQPLVPPAILHARPFADAEEMLVLTYTVNFAFFEASCLADALACGARITVVHDADNDPVPVDETPARGQRYLDVAVRCRSGGEFHPKLLVLANQQRALVAVGSGNMTDSGWHHNAEIWTLIEGAAPYYPTLFADLADWLDGLPTHLYIDHLGVDRVRSTAELLRVHPAGGSGPRLVHNLTGSFLENLHEGPTTELTIATPFFDRRASALNSLGMQLQPASTTIALTRAASFDAAALESALSNINGSAVPLVSNRYHHGKLIAYTLPDGRRMALTGSANCSWAALESRLDQRSANCELGVLAEISEADSKLLVPDFGDPLDSHALGKMAREGPLPADSLRDSSPVLVRAEADKAAVILTVIGLSPTVVQDARCEVLGGVDLGPAGVESFEHGGGVTRIRFAVPVASADLVQLRLKSGAVLGPVRITDIDRILERGQQAGPLDRHTIADALGRPDLADALLDALAQLADVRPERPKESTENLRQQSTRGWLTEWVPRAESAVGDTLVDFALGGAADRIDESAGHDEAIRNDQSAVDVADIGDDQIDTALTEVITEEEPPEPPDEPSKTRSRRPEQRKTCIARMFANRVDEAVAWPLPAQLALLRAISIAAAAGIFTEGTSCGLIEKLGRAALTHAADSAAGDTDAAIDDAAAADALDEHRRALAVVALTVIGLDIEDWAADTLPRRHFDSLRVAVNRTPTQINESLVRAYAAGLDRACDNTRLSPAGIVESLDFYLTDDLLTRAVGSLDASGHELTVDGRLVIVDDQVRTPRSVAYRLISRLGEHSPVSVRANSPTETVTVTWARPHIVSQTTTNERSYGKLFRPAFGVGALAAGTNPAAIRQWTGPIPADVQALIGHAP
jgi:hypothetical protein